MTRNGKHPASNGGKWIRRERRLAIYLRDGFACVYCQVDLKGADPRDVTLDHVIPSSHMGSNASDNLVTACQKCNSRRGNKAIHIWASEEALVRVSHQTRLSLNMKLAKSLFAQRRANGR